MSNTKNSAFPTPTNSTFVEHQLIIELKTVESILWIHEAQLLTYLKLSRIKRGLLLNFNVPLLKDGIKRMIF